MKTDYFQTPLNDTKWSAPKMSAPNEQKENALNVNASTALNETVSNASVSTETALTENALNALNENESDARNSMLSAEPNLILFAGPRWQYEDSMHKKTSVSRCWTAIARNGNACSGRRGKCSDGRCSSGIFNGIVNGSNSENSNSGIFNAIFNNGQKENALNVNGNSANRNGMVIFGRNNRTRRRFDHGVQSGCILAGIMNGSIGS
jgi:hypothetical protein